MLTLDIETTTFFADPEIAALPRALQLVKMCPGLAVTVDDQSAVVTRHWLDGDNGPAALIALWQSLQGQSVLGWNIHEFDLPLVMLHLKLYTDYQGIPWDEPLDVVDLFGLIRDATAAHGPARWYTLEAIAQSTLGQGKRANGQQAAQWLASGDPALREHAAVYCQQDVALTTALYHKARTTGLVCPPRAQRGETNTVLVTLDATHTPVAVVV